MKVCGTLCAVVFVASILIAVSWAAPAIPGTIIEDVLEQIDFDELFGSHAATEINKLNAENPANKTNYYVGILKCAIDVAKNVTDEYDLHPNWIDYEPTLLSHLEQVANCSSAGDETAVQACYDRESQASQVTYTEFLDVNHEINEEAASKITQLYNSVCYNIEPLNSMEISATTLGTIEQEQNRLICIMNAIDKVIKTTEFDELWQAYKMELSEAFQRWTACTELANASEITKCSAAEARNVADIIRKFCYFVLFHNGQYELIEKIREQILKDCG